MFTYNFSVRDLEYFLLILTRISCFVYTAPFFSTANVPKRVKLGLSFFIAMILYRFVIPHSSLNYTTIMGYAALVISEAACGLAIGFVAEICMSVLSLAGSRIDMDIGLSMVQMFDPTSRQQIGFSGTLYRYAILLLLIGTNMHHWLLRAFVDAFSLIPIGHINVRMESMVAVIVGFMTDAFIIAFRIYLPIFAVMMLLNSILGILAKVAPQLNMFAVGMQLKILVGFSALILTAGLLPQMSDFIFSQMKNMVRSVVEVMH